MEKKKVLLFAYDGTGLGHLMRLIKIASGFSNRCNVLVVSGHKALPELVHSGIDYYLLPNFYEERDKGKTNAEDLHELHVPGLPGKLARHVQVHPLAR